MSKKLLRLLPVASLALLLADEALAQTTGTTGNVTGVVTDASTGKPVVGAAVIATSAALQGEQTAVTDGSGTFNFRLLPPGQYKLFVPAFTGTTADGKTVDYKEAERSDIVVRIDKTLRANLALVPTTVALEEQVVRTGVAPVVNVGTAETGAVVTKEFLASVPVGRDFAASAIVAPGAQPDLYGTSFAGASSPENNFILDGMNVTDPGFGIQGSSLLTNFVEEVNVKSGSFMPEYGRATGGVINVVTKSGSNEFHGSLFGNVQPGAFSPNPKSIGRAGEAIQEREISSKEYRTDFGFEVGGPIMKDRLWFYLGFAPVLTHLVSERYYQALVEDPNRPGTAAASASTGLPSAARVGNSTFQNTCAGGDCTGTQYQVTGKLTYLLDQNNNVSLSLYTAPQSRDFLLNRNGLASAGYAYNDRSATDVVARYAGKFLEKHLIVEAQGGWHHQTNKDDTHTIDGVNQRTTSQIRWDLSHNLDEFYTPAALGAAYAACTPTATFDPCPVSRFLTGGRAFLADDKLDRFAGRLSASGLFSALGHHNVKGGIDIERSSYDRNKFYGGGVLLRERNTSAFGRVFQDYRGYVAQAPNPTLADLSSTALPFQAVNVDSITNSRAYYVQDSWSVIDPLTVNFGVRWETQDMYKSGASGPANLSISDNVGPRVQAIYDFTGQGRSAVKATWGRFYESIPLDMGDRSFGGEIQGRSNREYCVQASATVGGSAASCNRIPNSTFNALLGRNTTYAQTGGGAVPVAPDLKGQYVDMYGGSVEYEFLPDLSAGFIYEGRRLGRVIEDMSTDDGATYFIANPGDSKPFSYRSDPSAAFPQGQVVNVNPRTVTTIDPVTLRSYTVNEPRPDRRYDGFTWEVRKNFSKRWLALASYTYSVFRGNYPGLFRSETGQLDPNILSEYDLVSLLPNRYGPLPSDIPHQLKIYGSYIYDVTNRLNVQGGAALRASSGTPINYLGAHPDYGPGEAFILPRGSGGRTPWITQVDLRGALEYTIMPPYAVKFTIDIFNILNAQEALAVDQNYTFDSVQPIINGQCKSRNGAQGTNPLTSAAADCPDLAYLRTTDGRPVTTNKNFGRPTAYQAPIAFRFGLALSF